MDGELKKVFDTLTLVLRDVFDSDDLVATPELTARMVKGWDSLGNVRLFLEIERSFSIRFSSVEIAALRNVGQLAEQILRKKAERFA
jgi:acyl carrier protein